MMNAKLIIAGLIVAASCAVASAQQAQTVRLRGTIAKVEGDSMTLKISTGSLAAYLAASDNAVRCMERYWTYYTYGASTWSQDACTYDAIYNESKTNGFGLKSVLMSIIHAPSFTTRVQDQ